MHWDLCETLQTLSAESRGAPRNILIGPGAFENGNIARSVAPKQAKYISQRGTDAQPCQTINLGQPTVNHRDGSAAMTSAQSCE